MHMYVYECACVRMLHFETRKRLNCACIYVILLYATPPSACFVCIPTIVLGYWPCRPRIRAYACICMRVCVCHIDPYAETMVWDKFHDGYQPVVLPFILCICRSFLEATMRKNQIHTRIWVCVCACLSPHRVPLAWFACVRCGGWQQLYAPGAAWVIALLKCCCCCCCCYWKTNEKYKQTHKVHVDWDRWNQMYF